MRTPALALLVAALPLTAANAQHDYRNLDHGRPVVTEDAYPVEQRALEVMLPASYGRTAGAGDWMVEPELMWGAAPNGMLGLGAPIALGDGGGLVGLRPFAFYNFNTEMPALPALALRFDATLPIGALGGEGVLGGITAIATRSFGRIRMHLNAGATLGAAADAPLDDAPARWNVSLGVDHTLWRQSAVLVADVQFAESLGGGSAWLGGAGVRMQFSPSVVFDAGVARRLSAQGPDLFLTAGFTRSFALGGSHE